MKTPRTLPTAARGLAVAEKFTLNRVLELLLGWAQDRDLCKLIAQYRKSTPATIKKKLLNPPLVVINLRPRYARRRYWVKPSEDGPCVKIQEECGYRTFLTLSWGLLTDKNPKAALRSLIEAELKEEAEQQRASDLYKLRGLAAKYGVTLPQSLTKEAGPAK